MSAIDAFIAQHGVAGLVAAALVLFVGGLAKGEGLGECGALIPHVAAAYTIGEAGALFADLLAPHCRVERCEMLCEATTRAIAAAQPGDVVLLSPACASFDQFRDYEARGDDFRRIVDMLVHPDDEGGLERKRPCRAAGRSAA